MTVKLLAKRQKKTQHLNQYAGQWVALIEGEMVGHSANLKDLMEAMRRKGREKKVSVFLVPRKDEGPYIL